MNSNKKIGALPSFACTPLHTRPLKTFVTFRARLTLRTPTHTNTHKQIAPVYFSSNGTSPYSIRGILVSTIINVRLSCIPISLPGLRLRSHGSPAVVCCLHPRSVRLRPPPRPRSIIAANRSAPDSICQRAPTLSFPAAACHAVLASDSRCLAALCNRGESGVEFISTQLASRSKTGGGST